MKIPMGPCLMRRRRRRQGKAVVLAVLLVFLAAASSMTTWEHPVVDKWANPTIDQLNVARKEYEINGDNGTAHWYLTIWPQYADYIMGK